MNVYEVMKKYKVSPRKDLGQNFLVDMNIRDKIIESLDIQQGDVVIEVGPGLGILTERLVQEAETVLVVEIDPGMVKILNDTLSENANLHIINKDILKVNIQEQLDNLNLNGKNIKIVSNLPYYITTPVIMKFLESGMDFETMTFMVQKEVADRINANPGTKDYGAFTVMVGYFAQPEMVVNVSPKCFCPEPGVNSAVVKLTKNKENIYNINDAKAFARLVKASFGQRRKTLVNALSNSGYFNFSKNEMCEILEKEGHDRNIRGEKLSIMQFAKLSNAFCVKKT